MIYHHPTNCSITTKRTKHGKKKVKDCVNTYWKNNLIEEASQKISLIFFYKVDPCQKCTQSRDVHLLGDMIFLRLA